MSDLPKTREDSVRISEVACALYAEAFAKRNFELPTGTLGQHESNASISFIRNTVRYITLNRKDLLSENDVENFLAKRLMQLVAAGNADLANLPETTPTLDPQRARLERKIAEDHIAIECMAEAMGIGEETRAAINALTIAQEGGKPTGYSRG